MDKDIITDNQTSILGQKETSKKKSTINRIMPFVWTAVLVIISSILGTLLFHHSPSWKQFTSSEGYFSISLPGTPSVEKYPMDTAQGTVNINSYWLETKTATYMVSYYDYSDLIIQQLTSEQILESGKNEAVANVNGKLQSESTISSENYPGKQYVIAYGDGKTTASIRLYLVDHRLYHLVAVTSNNNANSQKVSKFLDSFQIISQ